LEEVIRHYIFRVDSIGPSGD